MDEMIGTIKQFLPMFTMMLIWTAWNQLMPTGAQAKAIVSISIYGENHVTAGSSHQLAATATLSDGSTADITSSVVWASSAPTIAGVSSSGVVVAVATGTAQITATVGSVVGTFDITVVAQTPGWELIDISWD